MVAEPIDPLRDLSRPGVVRPIPVDPTGEHGPTRAQARSSRWRRSSQGLYVRTGEYPDQVAQRIVEAAAVLPTFSAVTGWAALHWAGADYFDGRTADGRPLDVPLAVPNHAVRPRAGLAITAERLAPRDLISIDGLPLTRHVRSVSFAMRSVRGLVAAVRVLDMAMAADLISLQEMRTYVTDELSGWTGVERLRTAVACGDENSWSPMESEMRVLWASHLRIPTLVSNHPVFDRAGRFVATPDLLDVEAGLFGEYDGDVHLDRERRSRDIEREAALRRLGLEGVTMMATDRRDVRPYLQRVREARSRARFLPPEQRAWTIEPPPWWTPTVTVDQRRALEDWQKERFLRRKAG